MRTVVAWTETPPEKEGVKNVCYDLCFKPDGSQLVAAVGARVLLYDAADGELLHSLKGHKAAVYAVAYAANGKRFASGGADKTVIIWTSKAEGILKYSHGDSIQALAYNPVTQQLASGTAGDLGLWSPEQKSVTKHKVSSKILSLAWTPDGALLAAGCYDGSVSIRDRGGNEAARVAAGATPAWAVAWSPEDAPTLAVGCLDGQLRFFDGAGVQRHRDRQVQGDPLSLAYLGEDHLLAAGTDGTIQLLSREGVSLATLPGRSAWLWRVAPRPRASAIAYGGEDGSVTVAQLVFSTVHGLYGDRYAYREAMTDVIIQHLVTEQKVRIKCRDLVKKVAVYRGRVAVQLPTRVVVYELAPPADGAPVDESDMRYRAAAKIPAAWECNLLVVASAHLVLCQDKKLQLYDFGGARVREWTLEAVIRYIKVAGGPPGREALLVGLKSGQVVKIFVDNPFPIPLVSHGSGVRCLDVSLDRARLALVDEAARAVVYDLDTQAVLFTAEGANSVAWNSECADMLCYSGGGALSIRTGDFPPHSQRMQGYVVGFKGSKVFCLQSAAMTTIDVPQSASMFRYIERKDWAGAYRMACLGVTDADWRALAHAALQDMEFEVARSAFVRLRDPRAAELADRVAGGLRGGVPRRLLAAEALAWQGRYAEAARLYTDEGRLDKAVEMFSALRQFDEAKKWADDYARTGRGAAAGAAAQPAAAADLLGRQAEWSEAVANYAAAAEMYARAGRVDRAAALLARHGWWDRLLALVRTLEAPRHAPVLASAAAALRRAGQYGAAKEALLRLGDAAGLVDLAVATQRWEDAALLAAAHPELAPRVHLPRAAWLAARDRFDEARGAYRAAGRPDLGRALLRGLADAAARRERFGEAAAAHYRLAADAAQDGSLDAAAAAAAFESAYLAAELYAAYEVVHERAVRPFRTADDGTLFGAARFLCARLLPRGAPPPPPGVRLSTALLALARGDLTLGAFKTARLAYARLQALALPPEARADAELQSVMVRARPFADAEELLPVCFRCGATNAVVPQQEDACASCGAAFHYSPLTWQPLPLVEFEVEAGIGDDEALALIGEGAGDAAGLYGTARQGSGGSSHGGGGGGGGSGANVLRLDEPAGANGRGDGGLEESWAAQALVPRAPITLDRAALRRLRAGEVLLRRWPGGARRRQWFRVVDPDAAVVVGPCGHFFEADEFEMALLEHGVAPFSREPPAAEGNRGGEDAGAAAGA
ncbi:hypothetical protein Rsub_10459 [Raphidocelis subcapitata]|uniref:Intraflagellar transport protein 122 homolog n=1 Tax=Raphidocelis subcapitata TaxID=307507 RepID=A0A2V0PCG9_9CHLO|nr:hypothetical protein Rsub_10459 [Raphidocelis subcapitata]|eukprot:GBF97536.1 hypothetical protein Rsub_10459 [Raphidocelis subcapitata]